MRNGLILLGVVVLVFVMLVAGRHFGHRTTGPVLSGNAVGSDAPEFTLNTVDGKQVKLSDLRGKAVLLNFWATWCGPCKVEIPWFMELEKQYGPQGLVVVGVAMDDDAKDSVPKFAQEMKMDYIVVVGNDQVADQYGGVDGLPTTFYIGRDGKIVRKVAGLASHSQIEDDIKAALQTPATENGTVPASALVPAVAAQ